MRYCPGCRAEMVSDPSGQGPQSCPECGFVNWENPAPVATALLLKDGRVVLVKARTRGDQWGFPSGFVEKEETAEEGLLREVLEETNLRARITGHLGTYAVFNGRKRILLIAYEAIASGESSLNEEVSEIGEFEPGIALEKLGGKEEREILSSWLEKRNHLK